MNKQETGKVFVALVVVFNVGAVAGFYCGDYNKLTFDEYDDEIKTKIITSFSLGAVWGIGYEKNNAIDDTVFFNDLYQNNDIFYECYMVGKSNSTDIEPFLDYVYKEEYWITVINNTSS